MLTHEHPPGYGPRSPRYPILGPYIPTIDRLLHDAASSSSAAGLTIRDVVARLRREEGFAGSYESVKNYIRHQTCNDESAWERAYDLITQLPKPRALDVIRFLSRGDPSVLTSARLRRFVREAACRRKPRTHPNRERQRCEDIEWMRRVLQKRVNDYALYHELDDIPDPSTLLQHLHNGRLMDRNRAMVALASYRKIPSQSICSFLGVGRAFVRKYRNKFNRSGAEAMFAPHTKSKDDEELRSALWFASRTAKQLWHQPDILDDALLCGVLKNNGKQDGGPRVIRQSVTHFYSAKKNTGEMIRMMDILIDEYAGRRKLYPLGTRHPGTSRKNFARASTLTTRLWSMEAAPWSSSHRYPQAHNSRT